MGVGMVSDANGLLDEAKYGLSLEDREFVLQFAFRTEDLELTVKLVKELDQPGVDREAVRKKYEILAGIRPEWITRIENLLIALEMYREQEEKTIRTLREMLQTYGVSVKEEDMRNMDRDVLQGIINSQIAGEQKR